MQIYKRNQGRYTRLTSALLILLASAWGCASLYSTLSGAGLNMGVSVIIPLVVFAGMFILVFKIFNGKKAAEFLIATEGEMKKVSWSTKQEVVNSTKVVIVTTFLMASFLAIVDLVFAKAFNVMGITGF